MTYRHTQIGWATILSVLVIFGVLSVWCVFYMPLRERFPFLGFLAGFLGLICLFFGKLTVEVDSGEIRVILGPGLLVKRIPMNSVVDCCAVRTKWWYGWGIKLIPGGVMFNVSGLDGVELKLSTGRRIVIGTSDPNRLIEEIRGRMLR